jgi:hypothetical protein
VASEPGKLANDSAPSYESGHCRHFIVQLQHAGNCRGNQGAGCLSDRWPTGFTGQLPIGLHASLPGTRATHGKIEGDLVATAKVHFIWRLASEGGMGNNRIVLFDIERDQFFKRRECVQLVQK